MTSFQQAAILILFTLENISPECTLYQSFSTLATVRKVDFNSPNSPAKMQPYLKVKVKKHSLTLQFVGHDCTKNKATRSGLKNKYRKPLDIAQR